MRILESEKGVISQDRPGRGYWITLGLVEFDEGYGIYNGGIKR